MGSGLGGRGLVVLLEVVSPLQIAERFVERFASCVVDALALELGSFQRGASGIDCCLECCDLG